MSSAKNKYGYPDRLEGQELLRDLRNKRRLTQEEVAKRSGYSRITINRWEGSYDGMPKKPTVKARSRLIYTLLQGYGLYRDEADEILNLLGFELLSDNEWGEYGNPIPHFASVLQRDAQRKKDDRFQFVMANFGFHIIHADLHAALKVAEELLTLAQSEEDADLLVDAHCALGTTHFHMGNLELARQHLEQGLKQSDTYANYSHVSLHAVRSPKVLTRSFLSHTLWFMGFPDQALEVSRSAMALSQELTLPEISCVHFFASAFHSLRRELKEVQEHTQSAILLSSEFGATHWAAKAGIIRGWSLAKQGQTREGIEEIRRNLSNLGEVILHLARPYYLTLLAEVYGDCGDLQKGMEAMAEARSTMDKTGEYLWDAWLYLKSGELQLKFNNQDVAENDFRQAADIALRQHAKLLELRAKVSLASLWRNQYNEQKTLQTLKGVYSWFTEGFDTPDLLEAQALLEVLGQQNTSR
jgi:transcriptional regulator with XRE-family HTH domain